jgi:predicted amidophosphoribosyltransferase
MTCKKCKSEISEASKFCSNCGKKVTQESKRKTRIRGNGEGTVYLLPNGKYRAEVTLGYTGEKRICKTKSGFKTKKEA